MVAHHFCPVSNPRPIHFLGHATASPIEVLPSLLTHLGRDISMNSDLSVFLELMDLPESRTHPTSNLSCSNVFVFVNVNRWQTLGSFMNEISLPSFECSCIAVRLGDRLKGYHVFAGREFSKFITLAGLLTQGVVIGNGHLVVAGSDQIISLESL